MSHSPVLSTARNITLLGAGRVQPGALAAALAHAPELVAADGGANRALALGHRPRAVIGDLDSLGPAARAALAPGTIHHVGEQESTDFEKALSRIEAPLVLGLGFLAPRIDHQLAAFSVLLRYPHRRCVLIGQSDLCFLCPPALRLDLRQGTRVSLFPLAPVGGESEGLAWPIAGIAFAPGGRIGTSNRVAHGPVALRMGAPAMLVLVPRGALDAVVAGLGAAPPWPAEAG